VLRIKFSAERKFSASKSASSPSAKTLKIKKMIYGYSPFLDNKTSKSAKMKSTREIFKSNPSLLDEPEVVQFSN